MRKFLLYIFVCLLYASQLAAEGYTTIIQHKDGRKIAIATDKIDFITHIASEPNASYYNLTDSIVYPPQMTAMMGILLQAEAGLPNSALCNEKNKETLFSCDARFERPGESWTHTGMFSLIDDDVIDDFIPSSHSGYAISKDQKVGGYFSLLFPFIRSLEIRYGISLSCGLAMEGQRIGLTAYASPSDSFAINENGKLIQQLVSNTRWECLCHSMTARISPDDSWYIVDSLNSEEATEILKNGKWNGPYSFYTAGVYDRKTKRNYTITRDRAAWTETPNKYIQPYCFDPKTNQWIYNPTYPVDYQIGEWKRRATQCGFIYPDIMVHWGNTTAAPMINDSRTFFSHSVDPSGLGDGVNNVPLSATIHRINAVTGNDNVYNAAHWNKMKDAVDRTLTTHGWFVIMSHFNTRNFYNGYLEGLSYPEQETGYNPEWVNPLVTEEIRSMDENNYWENPPVRLGIANWGEWQPARGTQLWGLYRIFEYAIEQQLQNVSPSEGMQIMGNKVNIGIYRDQGLYPLEKEMELFPADSCYYVVGADGSIKYESYK